MAWKFYIKHAGSKKSDYTSRVGNVQWSESTDQLGAEFTFTLPFSKWDDRFSTHEVKCGDLFIIYKDGTEWNRGVITEIPINGSEYKGYDLSWYLNQSEIIVQFKKMRADKAIKQLCNKYDVPIGKIATMKTAIKKLYKDETVADVIKDILDTVEDETDVSHRLEMRKGKLYIEHVNSTHIKPNFYDEEGRLCPCQQTAVISGTRSMEDLRNYVVYAKSSDSSKSIKATAKNSTSIKKYGRLSVVETKDNLTKAKARQYAKNKLKRLNKLTVSFTCDMRGSTVIKAGRRIYFSNTGYNIKGWFKVKSVTHTINNGIHTVSMEMVY